MIPDDVRIPLVDVRAAHQQLEGQLVAAFRGALDTGRFIGGPEVEGFEEEFAAYCGTKYCVGVGSGTDALRFALMASGVGRGDAVVTVAHTFIATVEAISQAGAETEFVDIDERTYNMSAGALEDFLQGCRIEPGTGRRLGRRTGRPIRAVVPVHLYGQMADMEAIVTIAQRHGLVVVEDAAQAHGAEWYVAHPGGTGDDAGYRKGVWRRAGSMGKAAAFSFYPGKNLGACGEAGAVTTDDGDVAQAVHMIRDHGQTLKYHHGCEGYNGRLDAIQAAFLRIKLRHLDTWNRQRRAAAARYNQLLSASGDSILPFEPERSRAVYHLYVIRTSVRDRLAAHLSAQGIHTGFHYPVPVHLQPCYREWGYREGSLPITERVAKEILSLPMYPALSSRQQERVAAAIEAFGSRAGTRRGRAARSFVEIDPRV